MDEWRNFWADYWRCWELDPVQHSLSFIGGTIAVGAPFVVWAVIKVLS